MEIIDELGCHGSGELEPDTRIILIIEGICVIAIKRFLFDNATNLNNHTRISE